MRCFFVRICTVHLCNVHNAVVHPAVHDSRFRRTENNKLTSLFLLLNWIDSLGTSLRELVHKFRHRTLVLLKMLMLQKRVSPYPYLLSLPSPSTPLPSVIQIPYLYAPFNQFPYLPAVLPILHLPLFLPCHLVQQLR